MKEYRLPKIKIEDLSLDDVILSSITINDDTPHNIGDSNNIFDEDF